MPVQEILNHTAFDTFAIFDATLYWKINCSTDVAASRSRLSSMPVGGGESHDIYFPTGCQPSRVASANIALDEIYVYWISGNGKIVRLERSATLGSPVDICSCEATLVGGTPNAFHIALINGQLLWSEGYKLFSVPVTGGTRTPRGTTLSRHPVGKLVAAATQDAFICLAGGILQRINATSFEVDQIAAGVGCFAVNNDMVFWTEKHSGTTYIRQVYINAIGGTPVVHYHVAGEQITIDAISSCGNQLFWHERRNATGGPIMRLYLRTGRQPNMPAAISDYILTGLTFFCNNEFVYFANTDNNTVFRIQQNEMAAIPPSQINITGIELTQSIQTPDNRIPLIAGKFTFVRVYVRAEISDSHGPWAGVTARLTVDGIAEEFISASRFVIPFAGSDRRKTDDSFIFEIQGDATAIGERNFHVQLVLPEGRSVRDTSRLQASIPARFSFVRPYSAYGLSYTVVNVPIEFQAANRLTSATIPARPFSDFEASRRFSECMFPSPSFTIVRYPGDPVQIFDFDGGNNYQAARAWGHRLIDMLHPAASLAQRILLLQPDYTDDNYNGACQKSGGGNFVINYMETTNDPGPTLAHEIGHSWGLPHTFISEVFDWMDAAPYPDVEGSMGDQIGLQRFPVLQTRPGKDIDGRVTNYDVMSYYHPQWISPFNYCQVMRKMSDGMVSCAPPSQPLNHGPFTSIITRPLPGSDTGIPDPAGDIGMRTGSNSRQYLYFNGIVQADGAARFIHTEVVSSLKDITSLSEIGKYHVVLKDGKDQTLADFAFNPAAGCGHEKVQSAVFSGFLPLSSTAVELQIVSPDAQVIAALQAKTGPKSVTILPTGKKELAGLQTISWNAEPGISTVTYSLWYSPDAGEKWIPLNIGISETQAQVNFDYVPASDRAMLRVVASGGIASVESMSEIFRVGIPGTATTNTGVTEISLEVAPAHYRGNAPAVLTFKGTIAVNDAGTVQYRFIRSDGATGPATDLDFKAAGKMIVETTWTLGAKGIEFSGWMAIEVLSPNEMQSDKADFIVKCE